MFGQASRSERWSLPPSLSYVHVSGASRIVRSMTTRKRDVPGKQSPREKLDAASSSSTDISKASLSKLVY